MQLHRKQGIDCKHKVRVSMDIFQVCPNTLLHVVLGVLQWIKIWYAPVSKMVWPSCWWTCSWTNQVSWHKVILHCIATSHQFTDTLLIWECPWWENTFSGFYAMHIHSELWWRSYHMLCVSTIHYRPHRMEKSTSQNCSTFGPTPASGIPPAESPLRTFTRGGFFSPTHAPMKMCLCKTRIISCCSPANINSIQFKNKKNLLLFNLIHIFIYFAGVPRVMSWSRSHTRISACPPAVQTSPVPDSFALGPVVLHSPFVLNSDWSGFNVGNQGGIVPLDSLWPVETPSSWDWTHSRPFSITISSIPSSGKE